MSGFRWLAKVAPSTPAAGKLESFFDSVTKRLRVIDEKGQKTDISGGLDSLKLMINAGFKFAQRQVPGTLTSYAATGNRTYAADRWGMTIQTSSLQYARVDTIGAPETGLQARFYGQFKQITGAGKFVVSQVLESSRGAHLRNKQVRLMCAMKASSAKTIRFGLMQLNSAGTVDTIPAAFESAFGADTVDPTWGTNLALVAPDLLPVACFGAAPGTQAVRNSAIDCAVTTNWQSFGGLFTVPSNCKNLVVVAWTDAQFAINDILDISQVTLLNQSGDCDWNESPDEQDIEACQRYYHKTFPIDIAPAQNIGNSIGALRGTVTSAGATTGIVAFTRYPVQMRAVPTFVFFNTAAANAFFRNLGAATDATTTGANFPSEAGSDFIASGLAAWTVGQAVVVHYTANAEL